MKIAVIYKGLTGNTKMIAEAIQAALEKEAVVYCGEPKEGIDAELYFVGSWTNKGMCCKEILEFLKQLKNRKVAYFGTAGFGGSQEYYDALYGRVAAEIPESNEIVGHFFCQGKMPMAVRERYVKMMKEHPEDQKLEVSVKNFDEALPHPDQTDMEQAKAWARSMVR